MSTDNAPIEKKTDRLNDDEQNQTPQENAPLGKSVFFGLKWSVLERILAQVVTTVVSIVLARLLDPEHYGVVAIVSIFVTLCDTIVTSGLATALVAKKDSDELDFNSAFVSNGVMSLLLYVLLFFVSPLIASAYEAPELTTLIRVMGLSLLFSSFSSVQHSYMQKHFQFRTYFWGTFISVLVAGTLGITLALSGFGVWALAIHHMSKVIIEAILLLFLCKWKPKFTFSMGRIRAMLPFGSKMLISSVVMNLESDIRGLIIGKKFSKTDLAYYNNGSNYPRMIYMVFGNSISRVMLPAFSKVQEDDERLKGLISNALRIGAYLVTPIMLGFFAVAPNFILALFTEKWMQSVPFIQIFCLTYAFTPFENCCKECMLAKGKSGLILLDMCLTKSLLFAGALVSAFVFESVTMIALCGIVATVLSLILYTVQMKLIIGYGVRRLSVDLLPSYAITVVMVAVVMTVGLIPIGNALVMLTVQILAGMGTYVALSAMFRVYGFKFLLSKIFKRAKV